MDLLLPEAPVVDPADVDATAWPTQGEIDALIEAELEADRLAVVEAELRGVLAAVETAAAPVTGPLPVIVPLTKADAHDGTVAAVVEHACARLREISRTRRTSELGDVVAMLEAVI